MESNFIFLSLDVNLYFIFVLRALILSQILLVIELAQQFWKSKFSFL